MVGGVGASARGAAGGPRRRGSPAAARGGVGCGALRDVDPPPRKCRLISVRMNTRADSFGNDFRNSCARTGRGPGDPHAARPSLERSQLSLLAEARGPCARRGTLLCCPPSASPGGRGGFIHEEKELHHPRTPFLRAQTDGPVAQNPVRVPRRGRAQRPRRQGLLQDQTRSSAPPVCHLFGRSGHFGACTARALPLSLLLFPLCAGASGMLCCPATSSARGRSVWSCSGLFPCAWLWGSCLWRREPCPPAQRIACGSREHANSSLADSQQAPAR